ncbi:hypothetical protein LCGC14_2419490 [marine sediment metagenome]|uniref:Uncharacterized protein n=1 Tax=marine sediment metagenome TaxID=412755 RepID=A0A0F9E277_9ZZZZ
MKGYTITNPYTVVPLDPDEFDIVHAAVFNFMIDDTIIPSRRKLANSILARLEEISGYKIIA